jgi:hypothetical protein
MAATNLLLPLGFAVSGSAVPLKTKFRMIRIRGTSPIFQTQSEQELSLALADAYKDYPGVTSTWMLFFAGCLWHLDPTFFNALLHDFDGFAEGYDYQDILSKTECPVLFLRGESKLGAVMTDEESLAATQLQQCAMYPNRRSREPLAPPGRRSDTSPRRDEGVSRVRVGLCRASLMHARLRSIVPTFFPSAADSISHCSVENGRMGATGKKSFYGSQES